MTCPSSRKLVPMDPSIKLQIEDQMKDLPVEFKKEIEIKDEMYDTVPSSNVLLALEGVLLFLKCLK